MIARPKETDAHAHSPPEDGAGPGRRRARRGHHGRRGAATAQAKTGKPNRTNGSGQPWRNPGQPPGVRAGELLAALNTDQKIQLALGNFAARESYGVPVLKADDGPDGLRNPGPGVNVAVSGRALQEICEAPFRTAVQQGHADSVMCSYNQINGLPSCQNPATLADLKQGDGLKGFVVPDFGFAVRDPVAAALAGVDLPALPGNAPGVPLAAGQAVIPLAGITARAAAAGVKSPRPRVPPGMWPRRPWFRRRRSLRGPARDRGCSAPTGTTVTSAGPRC
ncbi:MAG TPA: hypothetical protein VFQ68_34310 [Streptosporangiaceae bacterium]|nr:hypothetical protein [Streptosporangiaceae bacterium]